MPDCDHDWLEVVGHVVPALLASFSVYPLYEITGEDSAQRVAGRVGRLSGRS